MGDSEYYRKLCWGVGDLILLYCCRIGIRTKGVGSVAVILFKNHSESENNLVLRIYSTGKNCYILFFIVGKSANTFKRNTNKRCTLFLFF